MAAMPRRSPPRRHALWPPTGDHRSSYAPPPDVAELLAAVPARADRAERVCRTSARHMREVEDDGEKGKNERERETVWDPHVISAHGTHM
uniref:Uncharacterized protein n=1 Tax=Oryza sativa subsp. japonica TaxID=39947 RepID=Q69TD0_ORYSJ|nr:hypothetical protein [Oryza sativa Japonica Group]